jgi:hypothetical protein
MVQLPQDDANASASVPLAFQPSAFSDDAVRPRLERKDGRHVFVGGKRITNEDVKRMLEEFP